jgi:hypothetical protein
MTLILRHPHYVSIFVYLTDVDLVDGPFEITSKTGKPVQLGKDPSVKVIGNSGTVVVWNRSFLHRASPNLGAKRRRIIKVSIQNNYLQNQVLTSGYFDNLLKDFAGRNKFISYLLGAEHLNSHYGKSLPAVEEVPGVHSHIAHNATVMISLKQILLGKVAAHFAKTNS